jgi:hypothetical protein
LGYNVACEFFHSRRIVDRSHFDLIHWDDMCTAMYSFQGISQHWITKRVCGCCGCIEHLLYFMPEVENIYLAYKSPQETTAHITICPDADVDRTLLFKFG